MASRSIGVRAGTCGASLPATAVAPRVHTVVRMSALPPEFDTFSRKSLILLLQGQHFCPYTVVANPFRSGCLVSLEPSLCQSHHRTGGIRELVARSSDVVGN